MLFTQTALVFAACESASPTPALVIALAERPVDGENCHEQAINVNLCLVHCLSADQSANTPQFIVPVWIDAAPLIVAVSDRWSGSAPIARFVLPRPAAPPPRILFQSFLI